jgi:GT2 family glycosyltransferase
MKKPNGHLPYISVVIPTYNRVTALYNCLTAVSRMNYPEERLETIVVNDGGWLPVGQIMENFSERIRLQIVSQKNKGPASARNRGARIAEGEYIAFTDDDCLPDTNWLRCLADRFEKTPGSAVGGKTRNILDDNSFSCASQIIVDFLYRYYNRDPVVRFLASNNLAVPAKAFRSVHGFNADMDLAAGEDREFCDRWRNHGFSLVYAPEALVHHRHELSLVSYWKQHYNYGKGAWCYRKIQAKRNGKKIAQERPSFYSNLLFGSSRHLKDLQRLRIFVLIVFSQIATTIGFFVAYFKKG